MTKKEEKKQMILEALAAVKVASSEQLEQFFFEHGSPSKRASECLLELEDEGFIEGKQLHVHQKKMWRLTRQGKTAVSVAFKAISFDSNKINHFLSIGDVYFSLHRQGGLQFFLCEPRQEFYSHRENLIKKYCPDAFFVWREQAYILEMQRSPLSYNKWKEKWKVAEEYFEDGHYLLGEWCAVTQKPEIVVVTEQKPSLVQGGSPLSLQIQKQFLVSNEKVMVK